MGIYRQYNRQAVVYRGAAMTLRQLSESTGVSYQALYARLQKGMSVEEAVRNPVQVQARTKPNRGSYNR